MLGVGGRLLCTLRLIYIPDYILCLFKICCLLFEWGQGIAKLTRLALNLWSCLSLGKSWDHRFMLLGLAVDQFSSCYIFPNYVWMDLFSMCVCFMFVDVCMCTLVHRCHGAHLRDHWEMILSFCCAGSRDGILVISSDSSPFTFWFTSPALLIVSSANFLLSIWVHCRLQILPCWLLGSFSFLNILDGFRVSAKFLESILVLSDFALAIYWMRMKECSFQG